MSRNIALTYVLSFLKYSWFWLGIWVLFYLQFTTYTGIGIVEMIMITSSFVLEIPTGALGDLLGKRKTLIIAYFLIGIANVWMGLSRNFFDLVSGVLVYTVGSALASGTFEALTYDTLVQQQQVSRFEKVLANQKSFQLAALTISSMIGGFMYQISPGLPFLAMGAAGFLGCGLCFFLIEPKVDTEKFSFKNYIIQNKRGFQELFKSSHLTNLTLLLTSAIMIYVVLTEGLEDMLLVEFGYTSEQLGIILGLLNLVLAIVAQLSDKVSKKFKPLTTILLLGLLSGISLVINPVIGWWLAPFFTTLRSSATVFTDVIAANLLNAQIESKYRSTALSAFEMLKKVPYVMLALPIGYIADLYSARILALGMGLLLIGLMVSNVFLTYPKIKNKSGY